jgi:hypothetical protein
LLCQLPDIFNDVIQENAAKKYFKLRAESDIRKMEEKEFLSLDFSHKHEFEHHSCIVDLRGSREESSREITASQQSPEMRKGARRTVFCHLHHSSLKPGHCGVACSQQSHRMGPSSPWGPVLCHGVHRIAVFKL